MMRQRLAVIGFSYLFGLLLASVFISVEYAPAAITAFLVLLSVAAAVYLKNDIITYLTVSFTVAFICYTVSATLLEAETNAIADGRTYIVSGTIKEMQDIGNDLAIYTISSDIADFVIYTDSMDVNIGDKLTLGCSFTLLENAAPFKSADYYLSQGIRLRAVAKTEIDIEKAYGFDLVRSLHRYREELSHKYSVLFSGSGLAMMKGIFIGDKSSFTSFENYCVKAAGVAHMTAVSGTHLTLIASILVLLLKYTKLSVFPRVQILVIMFTIFCFMVFFGLTGSVLRSGFMLMIHHSAGLFYRKGSCLSSLGGAVLIICLINPLACHDAGFILSVATTIGAGEISPRVTKYLLSRHKRLPEKLTSAVCCGVFSSLMGLPLSLVYFNMLSLHGVVVTIITVPIFTLVLMLMFLHAMTGGIFDFLLVPAYHCSKLMMDMFIYVAKLPYSHYRYSSPITGFSMLAGIIIAFSAVVIIKKHKGTAVLLCSSFVVMLYMGFIAVDKHLENGHITITPGSDGENGYVLITSPNFCGAVITGGGDYACTGLLTLMMGENRRHLDFLRITDNSTNSLKFASDMYSGICDEIILDTDDKYLAENLGLFEGCEIYDTHKLHSVGADILFTTDNTVINVNGYAVNISDIAKADKGRINICYGYQKSEPETDSQLFLIDKKQKKMSDICTALYYTETSIIFRENGFSINKTHIY
ncbi:MAG: ComEC/Rec2 family competence protein [Ruminiclostridium sp.]|nr:ComEC/Rec2 family competence protein [Ruminiclostridium sp.]